MKVDEQKRCCRRRWSDRVGKVGRSDCAPALILRDERVESNESVEFPGGVRRACAEDMRPLALLIAVTCVAVPAAALAASPLDALVAEVLGQNPSLRARVQRQGAASEDARAAGRWPDPSVTVMVDRLPPSSMSGAMPPMVQYGVKQMVPWPGKLGFMREAADWQTVQAGSNIDVRKLDLALEAKRAYWMLALNAQRRQINRANRNVASMLAAATLGRYSTGLGGHHDVARAQVEVAALDVQHIDLEGERASTLAMINALRNEPTDTPFPDPAPTPSPSIEVPRAKLVERALAIRPELHGMHAMQSEALAMASLERRERYPDIMAGLWYNQMIGMPDSAGAMIGATVPIFGYARQGHRAAAYEAKASSAVEDQAAMQAMIRSRWPTRSSASRRRRGSASSSEGWPCRARERASRPRSPASERAPPTSWGCSTRAAACSRRSSRSPNPRSAARWPSRSSNAPWAAPPEARREGQLAHRRVSCCAGGSDGRLQALASADARRK